MFLLPLQGLVGVLAGSQLSPQSDHSVSEGLLNL